MHFYDMMKKFLKKLKNSSITPIPKVTTFIADFKPINTLPQITKILEKKSY